MPAIPDLDKIDIVFGNIDHLPAWDDLPKQFRDRWHGGEPHCDFVSGWFYNGLTAQQLDSLKEKLGVDRSKALAAINAILASWEPKHEHKIAGCGYLLSEWFDLIQRKP
jgi:hypothetical protein